MKGELAPLNSDSFLQYSLKLAMKSRSFKSKGGIIVLLLVIFVLFLSFRTYDGINKGSVNYVALIIGFGLGIFLFPLSGWLGDAIVGRYKVVKYTVLILWASTMLHSALTVLAHIMGNGHYEGKAWMMASNSFQVVWVIMYGIFMVNSFHLGADQVMDAPSWQVSSFVNWYCWAFFLAGIIKVPFSECLSWETVNVGFSSLMITLGMVTLLLFQKDIAKEPTSSNSLKLIFQVLKYSIKNKYPQLRSAFSYWNEKMSRINLAKAKYGGPFSSEEVESVKTFFRVVVILGGGCFFLGHFVTVTQSTDIMFYHYRDKDYSHGDNIRSYAHCLIRGIATNAASILLVLGIPFFECFVNRFCWKYTISVTSSKKIVAGMILMFANQCMDLALEVVGHRVSENNTTIPCLFNSNRSLLVHHQTVGLGFYWLALPKFFSGTAYFLIFTSTAEFMYAQSPYSMKGLLIGVLFSFLAVSFTLSIKLRTYFKKLSGVKGLSCGTWYFMFSSALIGILTIVIFVILKWYSKRRRRDNVVEESNFLHYSANYDVPVKSPTEPQNYYM